MKHVLLEDDVVIDDVLHLESDVEHKIVADKSFVKGLFWGKPRFGHPEGFVIYHIREVLENVDRITNCPVTRRKLRLITLIHDTFKYKEEKARPRDWTKHHAIFARDFAKQFSEDEAILNILELHDEAYYCWRLLHVYRDMEKAQQKLNNLISRLGDNLQLYYLFFKCDTRTGDKNQAPLMWFEQNIPGIQVVNLPR